MTEPLAALRVLIVEDNYMIATCIEEMLMSAGCLVSGPVPRLAEACDAASREDCDAALLDINLNGDRVYPVADILSRRNVPYLFVTGYNDTVLPSEYAQRPRIGKPFKNEELLGALSALVKPAAANPVDAKMQGA